jgi:hypothetical protein
VSWLIRPIAPEKTVSASGQMVCNTHGLLEECLSPGHIVIATMASWRIASASGHMVDKIRTMALESIA